MIETIELTAELCFKIIRQNHNKYFKAKELVEEIIVSKYDVSLSDLWYDNNTDFIELKSQITKKLISILHDLKESGLIEKYSRRFWKITEVD